MDSAEKEIKNALREIEEFRTEECLGSVTIGLFAEGKLQGPERQAAENHLLGCPYCLKHLNDIKELLYYEKHPAGLSSTLVGRLKNLCPAGEKKSLEAAAAPSLLEGLKALVVFPARQWRYGAVSLATAFAAVAVCLVVLRPYGSSVAAPQVDGRSFVNVSALDDNGRVVNEAEGVVVGTGGLVASNLYPLAGARALRITLKDGRTYRTTHLWRDEEKNLAVMKIGDDSLPSIPMGDIGRISIGQTVFLVPDRRQADKRFKESVVSNLDSMAPIGRGRPRRYIHLATIGANGSRGAIVDRQGRLLGLVITEEKTINLAVPISDAERLVRESSAVAVSELKGTKFSAEALNFYLKGILARDGELWDEAIDCLSKAVALNPNLAGAYLELGYAFYRKRLYDQEARAYEDVLKIDPRNSDALFNLASNLQMRGEYGKAIKKYERVVAIDPEDAEAEYRLGLAYLAQGEKEKAMAVHARLRALNRGYAEMLRRLSER